MRSEKQREASRKNGAKSRGPKTPEGKRISALNATRRSLLAKTMLIEGESPAHFDALLRQLISEHQPLPGAEMSDVESLVSWRWKQLRLMGIESAVVSNEIRNHRGATTEPLSAIAHAGYAMRNLTDRSRILAYLATEQASCELQYSRVLRRLAKRQAGRAKIFQPVEPGVPPPEPRNSLEMQPPSESPATDRPENEPTRTRHESQTDPRWPETDPTRT